MNHDYTELVEKIEQLKERLLFSTWAQRTIDAEAENERLRKENAMLTQLANELEDREWEATAAKNQVLELLKNKTPWWRRLFS